MKNKENKNKGNLIDILLPDDNPRRLVEFSEMDISKASIQEQIMILNQAIDNGEVDPMKAVVYFKGIEAVIASVKKSTMGYAIDEFDKYHEKHITCMGSCEVSKVEAGVRYDFSNTEVWTQLKADADEAMQKVKDLEAMLKTLKAPMETVWDDVLEQLNPPIKTSTTTLKVTIK